ncbi:AGAP011155-PA-like protein [Anopheles sinensis]|uniref:AGAP011155-PA-like protein n=1 Tax=Anopheles sinensis TaxID=74873 RepID=A0A084VHT2_ANOSI|nr:AGAP011155-PA-like protein [Anopheles sinensis]
MEWCFIETYKIPNNERFTPTDAIEQLKLGLVIDLTNTKRYYNPQEFISRGVKYEKFAVQGHCGAPKLQAVRRFIQIVNQFMEDGDSSRDKLIGVHCTHGLNRTGYMVCAYMILQMGFRAKDAIELFNEKRGHTMERDNYLESLHSLDKVADMGCGQKEWEQKNSRAEQHTEESTHGWERFSNNRSRFDNRHHSRNHVESWRKGESGTNGHERFSRDRSQADSRHHQNQEDSWRKGERGNRFQQERKSWRQPSAPDQFSGEGNYQRQERFPRDQSRDDTRQHGYRGETWYKDNRPTQYQRDRDTRYQAGGNTQQQGDWRDRNSWRRKDDVPGGQHSSGIDDWDSATKRINRFPPGRYGGVPKRTVFE